MKNVNKNISEDTIMNLADDMAAAATTFNAHGYEVFIRSRELFKETLHDMIKEYNEKLQYH
jgi:hypothetical protein